MVSQQKTAQMPIARHYYWVQEEFIRLRDKLAAAMATPSRVMGLEIVDGQAALMIWEQSLRRTTTRLPLLLRIFSSTVLARSQRPDQADTQRALIPLEQEVNRLIALHRQLWQQPFSAKMQEGQVLLSRCIGKIASDLHELFSFFIDTVSACARGGQRGETTYQWHNEISCRAEMAEYRSWLKAISHSTCRAKGLLALPRLLGAMLAGLEERGAILSNPMP